MKISIRTNILIVFLLATLSIAAILLFSQYYFSKKIALEATHKNFVFIAKNISKNLDQQRKSMQNFTDVLSKDPVVLAPISWNENRRSVTRFAQFMQMKPSIKSIYYTDKNGSFFELIFLDNIAYFRQYGAVAGTQWVSITLVNGKEKYSYFDKNLHLLTTYIDSQHYFYKEQLWYKDAYKHRGVVLSDPYLFTYTKARGITFSKRTNEGVVGVDYTLQTLAKVLALTNAFHTLQLSVFTPNGKCLVGTTRNINTLEKNYQYETVLENGDQLVIRVEMDELLAPYKENLFYSFIAALVLIALSLPIIYMATGFLIRPVKQLLLENNKIAKRMFDCVEKIDTNIVEFDLLSRSLVTMSHSINQYQTAQEQLLDSIIKLIAEAIDAKSSYTGGHCKRVPEIATMLLDAANEATQEPFKNFKLRSQEEKKEFEIAAWLHDCGKVTTPEYVVDKATKLETIYNRIHEIRMRFEVVLRDTKIAYLEGKISDEVLKSQEMKLHEDFAFIATVNLGGEFLSHEKKQRIYAIAQQTWLRHFDDRLGLSEVELERYKQTSQDLPIQEYLLADKDSHIIARENFDKESYEKEGFAVALPKHLYNYGELYNLCIERGTLTPEERFKINEHVMMSIKMLEKIPFPSYYANVPRYAGNHHETLDGQGYPRKLTEKDLQIQDKIMAIADIFEALTASDRPYKQAKTLSQTLHIMAKMADAKQIDKDLFHLFLDEKIYLRYAQKYLDSALIDEDNIDRNSFDL